MAQPVEDQIGSLFGDPMTDAVNEFDVEVVDVLVVSAQQIGGDDGVSRAVGQRTGTFTRASAYSPPSQLRNYRIRNTRYNRDSALA